MKIQVKNAEKITIKEAGDIYAIRGYSMVRGLKSNGTKTYAKEFLLYLFNYEKNKENLSRKPP